MSLLKIVTRRVQGHHGEDPRSADGQAVGEVGQREEAEHAGHDADILHEQDAQAADHADGAGLLRSLVHLGNLRSGGHGVRTGVHGETGGR